MPRPGVARQGLPGHDQYGCQGCFRSGVVNAGFRQPTPFGSDRPPATAQNDDNDDRHRQRQSPISREGCEPVSYRSRETPPGPPHIENRESQGSRRQNGSKCSQVRGAEEYPNAATPRLHKRSPPSNCCRRGKKQYRGPSIWLVTAYVWDSPKWSGQLCLAQEWPVRVCQGEADPDGPLLGEA